MYITSTKIQTDLFMACRTQYSLVIRQANVVNMAEFVDELGELLVESSKSMVWCMCLFHFIECNWFLHWTQMKVTIERIVLNACFSLLEVHPCEDGALSLFDQKCDSTANHLWYQGFVIKLENLEITLSLAKSNCSSVDMNYLVGDILSVRLELVVALDGAVFWFVGSSREVPSSSFFMDIMECMLHQMSFRKVPVLVSCKTNIFL